MVFWIASAVGLSVAYLLGSTPAGYLAGKLLKGIDLREHGSKSIGATNASRTLGKWPALVVLPADVLKGVCAIVPTFSSPWLARSRAWGKVNQRQERIEKRNRKCDACTLELSRSSTGAARGPHSDNDCRINREFRDTRLSDGEGSWMATRESVSTSR